MATKATGAKQNTGLTVDHLTSVNGDRVTLAIGEPERIEDGQGIYVVPGDGARQMPWLGELLRSLGFRFKRTVPPHGNQEWARPVRAVVVDEVRFRVVG